jgi:hypothetical protein
MRDRSTRINDTHMLLANQIDAWVASANEHGDAHLVPLSFAWTGTVFLMASPVNSITTRNLARARRARIAIGPTRDVVIVEGQLRVETPEPDDARWDVHANGSGFDARNAEVPYALLTVIPEKIQAWRTPEELEGRVIMRRGRWLS